jgi:hypothetical protein
MICAKRFGPALAVLFAGTVGWARAAWAVDISECHVYVHDGEVGVLTQDIVCNGSGIGVVLGEDAVLQLAGHAISVPPGATLTDRPYFTIACYEGPCAIEGPGSISGASVDGIYADDLDLRDVDVHDNAGLGVDANRDLVAVDVAAHDNGTGIAVARNAMLTNVSSTRNEVGISVAKRLRGTGITASNNTGLGLSVGTIRVSGLTATDNSQAGIFAWRSVLLDDATVTGNGGSQFGIDALDIYTRKRPRLTATVCDHSWRYRFDGSNPVPYGTWGLCSGD